MGLTSAHICTRQLRLPSAFRPIPDGSGFRASEPCHVHEFQERVAISETLGSPKRRTSSKIGIGAAAAAAGSSGCEGYHAPGWLCLASAPLLSAPWLGCGAVRWCGAAH
eukprot:6208122-Pleurochrysis_carterae.AAC.2